MHTNWCVLIEISMEIGMLNFLSVIIGHCTEGRISLYKPKLIWQFYTWLQFGWVFGETELSKLLSSILLTVIKSAQSSVIIFDFKQNSVNWFLLPFNEENFRWQHVTSEFITHRMKNSLEACTFLTFYILAHPTESVPHITVHCKWCHQNALAYINCESQWGEKLSGGAFLFKRN